MTVFETKTGEEYRAEKDIVEKMMKLNQINLLCDLCYVLISFVI